MVKKHSKKRVYRKRSQPKVNKKSLKKRKVSRKKSTTRKRRGGFVRDRSVQQFVLKYCL
jgi:hypothetical protein